MGKEDNKGGRKEGLSLDIVAIFFLDLLIYDPPKQQGCSLNFQHIHKHFSACPDHLLEPSSRFFCY